MKKEVPRYTPEQVILEAFTYFKTDSMDEESLVLICVTAGCPGRETAIAVLVQMVKTGKLAKFVENNHFMYRKVSNRSGKLH